MGWDELVGQAVLKERLLSSRHQNPRLAFSERHQNIQRTTATIPSRARQAQVKPVPFDPVACPKAMSPTDILPINKHMSSQERPKVPSAGRNQEPTDQTVTTAVYDRDEPLLFRR